MQYVNVEKDVKIAVYDVNTSCPDAVFMVHGWPLSEKIFEYQKNLLICNGYRVITIDLRGYGNSDAPACGYSYDRMAEDTYIIIRRLGLYNFTLAGFSMGGAIVCRYMSRFHGFGVKKLVLLGAAVPRFTQTCDFPYGVSVPSVEHLIDQVLCDRAQFSENFSNMLLYSEHSEAIKKWFCDISLSASLRGTVMSGCALRDEDSRNDLYSIQVPTGIFHGRQDMVVPYELALLQKDCIKDSRLYTFENSGHGVFYDELASFNCTFLNFLKC